MDREYVVAYTVTRNWYQYMPTVINSLLVNNPYIDKIYVFAEDDEIIILKDPRIEIINVGNYPYIDEEGKNKDTQFSKMSMVRCYLSRYVPEDFILYLDTDTIIKDDIKEIWDYCDEIKYVGMVREDGGLNYFNSGVCLFNLKQIWEDGKDLELIDYLNNNKLTFPDQDAINYILGTGKGIKEIHVKYNSSKHTQLYQAAKIQHFTGPRKAWLDVSPDYKLWKQYYIEKIDNPFPKSLNIYQRILRAIKNRKEDTKCSK